MHKLLYYGFVYPISLLPLSVLYLLRPGLFFLLYHAMGYRKKVVLENLRKSFPELHERERLQKAKAFYWHLSALLVEAIKNLSFSGSALRQRIHYSDASLVLDLQQQGHNVLLVGGHYGNWEWLITSLGLHFTKNLYGLGMPITSSFWQQKLTERRERFGLKVIHSHNYREVLRSQENQPFVLLMLADQSPGDSKKSYWMEFLQQPTAVAFGTELLANEMNAIPVVVSLNKVGKGAYEVHFEKLTDTPKMLKFGTLTEDFTRRLESKIYEDSSLWLWSHKRWKREVPEGLESLRNAQEQRFNQKYR